LKYGEDYIWKYFSSGFDVIFCGTTQSIKKIVLYTNAMGYHIMMKYSKCNFVLEKEVEAAEPLSHSSTWISVKNRLGDPLGPPVIFDREDNAFGCTSFFAYQGLIFEVQQNNYIASLTVY
jgi:hypothetical protein